MKLYVHVLGYERAAQTHLLIESFFKYMKGEIQVSFNILYGNNTAEWAVRDAFTSFASKHKNLQLTRREIKNNTNFNLDDILVENELNLILPGNTIFTNYFNLDDLYYLDLDKEYLDLYKGLNRVLEKDGEFLNVASKWGKRDSLYFTKESNVFKEVHNNYGKIFKHTFTLITDKTCFFFGISPCLLSTVNFVETVDDHEDLKLPQFSLYTMGLRYLMGEIIDSEHLHSYCSNKLYDSKGLIFKLIFGSRKLNSLVDGTFYINLNRRHDRREQIDNELAQHKISAERQEGFDITDEELHDYLKLHPEFNEHDIALSRARVGCTKSHLAIIQKAKDRGYESVLIFEDDCKFIADPHEISDKAFADMSRLPECDMLYLGANVLADIQPLSPNLGKMNGSYCAHAYIVFKKVYDHILNFEWDKYRVIDELYMNISRDERFNVYTVLPLAAVQRASYSDIEQKEVDYTNVLINSYNSHLK